MIEILPSIGILDARARLTELCGEVARSGQSIWLCRRGTPIVELRPLRSEDAAVDRETFRPRQGIMDLWKDCQQRFGAIQEELPAASWRESSGNVALAR